MYLLISGTYEIKEVQGFPSIDVILLPPNSEAADLIIKHNFEVDVESHHDVISRWIP